MRSKKDECEAEFPSDDWEDDWLEKVIEECRWKYEAVKRILGG